MKIAITGGAGFIGTALASTLKSQGHELVLLDLKKSDVFPEESHIVDVTNKNALIDTLESIDVIYHLAAEHCDNVEPAQKYYDVNVDGAVNIVAAAEANNIDTIIYTSTVAHYGLSPENPKTGSKEEDALSPFNNYGESKWQAEQVFEKWVAGDQDKSLTIIRLVATFGPGNRGNIYTLMDQINHGTFMMVGSGQNKKSIAYVENVVAFLLHCLNFGPGIHLYNYADKPDLTTKELVLYIRSALGLSGPGPKIPYAFGLMGGITFDLATKLTGISFPISSIRVKKFCANTVVNADKLKESGFIPPFSLKEGLNEMIASEFLEKKKAA